MQSNQRKVYNCFAAAGSQAPKRSATARIREVCLPVVCYWVSVFTLIINVELQGQLAERIKNGLLKNSPDLN